MILYAGTMERKKKEGILILISFLLGLHNNLSYTLEIQDAEAALNH